MEKEELLSLDKNIYGLTILLTEYIVRSVNSDINALIDLANLVNKWDKFQNMTYVEYVEEVRNWAFKLFNRETYDDISNIINDYSNNIK